MWSNLFRFLHTRHVSPAQFTCLPITDKLHLVFYACQIISAADTPIRPPICLSNLSHTHTHNHISITSLHNRRLTHTPLHPPTHADTSLIKSSVSPWWRSTPLITDPLKSKTQQSCPKSPVNHRVQDRLLSIIDIWRARNIIPSLNR